MMAVARAIFNPAAREIRWRRLVIISALPLDGVRGAMGMNCLHLHVLFFYCNFYPVPVDYKTKEGNRGDPASSGKGKNEVPNVYPALLNCEVEAAR
jgi:hypothetical protein